MRVLGFGAQGDGNASIHQAYMGGFYRGGYRDLGVHSRQHHYGLGAKLHSRNILQA